MSAYAPLGCSTRGRHCRIGSLRQARVDKFAPGHACRRECLAYEARLRRQSVYAAGDLETWQSGNAILYRHDLSMAEELAAAVFRGEVDRIVYNGYAHAHRRPDQPIE